MYSRKLEIFIEVAREGSFNKAAQKLYISPTAVMKQIDQLEEALGFDLFHRSPQGVELTEAGKYLFEEAQRILAATEEAVRAARALAKKSAKTIRLGKSFLYNAKLFFPYWQDFVERNPAYNLKIVPFEDKQLNMVNTIKTLGSKFDIMFGVCDSREWLEHVKLVIFGEANFTCAVSKKQPLSKRKVVKLDDLQGQNLIMVKKGQSLSNDRLRSFIQENYPQIKIVDADGYYDMDVFNSCEESNTILLSLDLWSDIHPSLNNIPLAWQGGGVPYGIMYSKEGKARVEDFIKIFSESFSI